MESAPIRKVVASHLTIKTLTGKTLKYGEWPEGYDTTILKIKLWIQDQEGIPPVQQRLIFAGKELKDEQTFRETGSEKANTWHLVLSLRDEDQES